MALNLDKVQKMAKAHDYVRIDYQPKLKMVSYFGFMKVCCRINIYLSTGTVATCLDHPVKGKTQLFRKRVTIRQLNEIFRNPRVHTGKGYY